MEVDNFKSENYDKLDKKSIDRYLTQLHKEYDQEQMDIIIDDLFIEFCEKNNVRQNNVNKISFAHGLTTIMLKSTAKVLESLL